MKAGMAAQGATLERDPSAACGCIPSRIAGRRILITRSAEDAGAWAERVQQLGAQPIVLPCLVVTPCTDAVSASTLRATLAGASWLVLSSRRGVEVVAGMLNGTLPPGLEVAAVGPATARAASALLGRVDLVGPEKSGRSLAGALVARLAGMEGRAHVVVAGAVCGRTDVERALDGVGIRVTRMSVYEVLPAPAIEPKHDLSLDRVDAVLLASPSAAQGLVNRAVLPAAVHVITIGPTTTAAAEALGLSVFAQARWPGLGAMLEAVP